MVATASTAHDGPWTEEDLLTLPDDGQRYELLEGALVLNPPPSGLHQQVSFQLHVQLKAACPRDLEVVEALGVRLPDGSMFIPDVVVAEQAAVSAAGSGILDPGVVRLARRSSRRHRAPRTR